MIFHVIFDTNFGQQPVVVTTKRNHVSRSSSNTEKHSFVFTFCQMADKDEQIDLLEDWDSADDHAMEAVARYELYHWTLATDEDSRNIVLARVSTNKDFLRYSREVVRKQFLEMMENLKTQLISVALCKRTSTSSSITNEVDALRIAIIDQLNENGTSPTVVSHRVEAWVRSQQQEKK